MNDRLKVVVPLRDAPPLTDIAGQLRQLADMVERGGEYYGDVRACYVLLEHDDCVRPTFMGWGDVRDRQGMAGLFFHAAQLALTDK